MRSSSAAAGVQADHLKPPIRRTQSPIRRSQPPIRRIQQTIRSAGEGLVPRVLHPTSTDQEPQRLDGLEGRDLGWQRKTTIGPGGPLPTFGLIPDTSDAQTQNRRGKLIGTGRWLRDVCACPQCRNQNTGQKQFNVLNSDPAAVTVAKTDLSHWPECVKVTFQDGHKTTIPYSLLDHRYAQDVTRKREGLVELKTWAREIEVNPPTVAFADVLAGPGMAALMRAVRTYGLAFIDNMPATPEVSQQLLESIGPIRNTHYGGFYDFTSDLSSKDTAYTSEALEPHTDNTYFTEPAGLQALHLLSHTDGSGGESSLVDGFRAAEQLFKADPFAYFLLSTTGVHAHASGNEGISIQPAQAFPTFTHNNQHKHDHRLTQVRWNTADRAGVATGSWNLEAWYDAAAKFDAIVNDRENQYWFQLKPGRMLLFDNWRVLHGRSAFTGKRRICGGYINRDDWISKFRMTNMSEEEIKASTVTG